MSNSGAADMTAWGRDAFVHDGPRGVGVKKGSFCASGVHFRIISTPSNMHLIGPRHRERCLEWGQPSKCRMYLGCLVRLIALFDLGQLRNWGVIQSMAQIYLLFQETSD